VPDFRSLLYNRYNFAVNLLPLSLLIKISGQRFILPCYHVISDSYMPHIANLYKYKNISSFRSDLDFFLKYYKPVDLPVLIDMIKNNRKFDSNTFFLSFDDGLKEFYNIIAPILLEKGIPATCFLNSAFIDNKDMFFRYKASILIDLIKNTGRKSGIWKSINIWFADNNMSLVNYRSELLKIKYDSREKLDELAKLLDFNFRDYLNKEQPYLTSYQINELIKKGFYFGSHSINHPEYRYIPLNEQINQTKISVEDIAYRFKLNYRIFAFPFTDFNVPLQFFQEINRDNSLDFTAGCAGIKHDSIKNNLQRIPMDEYFLKAAIRIRIDYFYFLIKSVFNRNRIIRR
jgi:peptidoglycan/xylan/chitin deacetylase (PgdA/CDA1 family)